MNPLKSTVLILLIILNSNSVFSQQAEKMILKNRKGKTIYTLYEGDYVRIKTIDTFKMVRRYHGILDIANDSLIKIDGNTLSIGSIYKIGRPTKATRIWGHSIAGTGISVIAFSGYLAFKIQEYDNPISQIFLVASSTVFLAVGTTLISIGETIAIGTPKRVMPEKKLIIIRTSTGTEMH